MTRSPLVSVIVPTYNYGRYVTDAIESALRQTYSPAEIIVVDDGSTDDTRERLSRFRDRLTYVYQENRGLSGARNTGIRHARGEWIALLDSDDLWHPQKLAVQIAAVAQMPAVALAGSPPAAALPQELPSTPEVRPITVPDLLVSTPFGPSGAIIRRDCFDAVGLFDESLRSVEDRDMWLRVAARFSCVQIDSPCWWYRPHPGQMNKNADRMRQNYERVLAKFFSSHSEWDHLTQLGRSYMDLDSAWCYWMQGETATAWQLLVRSWWRHPQALHRSSSRRWLRAKLAIRFMSGLRPAASPQ